VYSARLGASIATIEPSLHRATNVELRTKPTFVNALPQQIFCPYGNGAGPEVRISPAEPRLGGSKDGGSSAA